MFIISISSRLITFPSGLIDEGRFSSVQGNSLSASSFYTCLLHAADSEMSLALCLQVASQARLKLLNTSDLSKRQGRHGKFHCCSLVYNCIGVCTAKSTRVQPAFRPYLKDYTLVAVSIPRAEKLEVFVNSALQLMIF